MCLFLIQNLMKIKFILFFYILLLLSSIGRSQTIYLSENFDASTKPSGWTYQYVSGGIDWKYQDGGYTSGLPGTGEPAYAFQGERNAMFYYASIGNETTKLITPAFDLSYAIKPELIFWHAQADKLYAGSYNHDELRIYYKTSISDPWVLLAEYTDEVPSWTERNIQLPDSSLTNTYYIAFEGKTKNGFGTCIDSMYVIETGITPKYIESLVTTQPITHVVPTSSQNNRILRIDISVKGNDGSISLDSIAFNSLNTNDNDILTNGVKLFASDDNSFNNAIQIGTGQNFTGGSVSFYNLNHELPTGFSSLWLTYDIKDDLIHELQNHILDAYVPENGIKISNNYFPLIDQSPAGNRTIAESIFYDDFENGMSWTLTGEFEHGTPEGLGGPIGSPDPIGAYSGSFSIGTDITGLGDSDGNYEFDLNYHDYEAITPSIDAEFYYDTKLYFSRWLNIEVSDSAFIEYSDDNGASWNKLWLSSSTITDDKWQFIELNTSGFINKIPNVKLNFSIGGSNDAWNLAGWNIDDVFLTGNYISKDVGVTNWIAPLDGCGHADEEYVEITIKNYAGDILTDPLPVSYSFDNGATIYYDTIVNPNIPVYGSIDYIITKPIDLTTPGWYNNVYATTNLPEDENSSNNKIDTSIFISPTYSLPYSENFETNYGYYISGGTNSTWQYGIPNNTLIDTAASGTKAWVTNLTGSYLNNDSSYLESPCFDFSGTDSIVFEFKCKGLSEDQTDGLALLYSTNQGATWQLVPNNNNFDWNWYNESLISELELPGIDTTNGEWLTFKQILPPVLSNQSSVKFRFVFESNAVLINEGFGIDDIKIYRAPYDIGVRSLKYPFTKCELSDTTSVKIYIENYGISDVVSGTKIPVSLNFESQIINDTLTLGSDLIVGDSILFTFDSKVDMSYADTFNFIINTNLESNTYFYNDILSNDTLTSIVYVNGMPNYDIGWIVGTDDLDTLLDAGIGYSAYFWDGPVEDSTTQTYRATVAGVYYVTVTNTIPCQANDSLKVVPSLVDVKMDSILTELEDSCERFDSTIIKVTISNKGAVLNIGDSIPFGYQINNLPEIHDTLILDRNLTTATDPATDTINFTFKNKCDLTEIGNYTIRVFTNFADDLNRTDDKVTTSINTWGLPVVDLAYDTIYSSQADTLTLDAGAGFLTYDWNSGSSTQTETPSNSSYYYKVTVQDVNSCGIDKDSTYIETHDLGVSAVTSPANICEDLASATTSINVEITNYSDSIYNNADVKIFYKYDSDSWEEVNLSTFNVGASGSITINNIGTVDAANIGEHTLKIYTSSDIDANHTNDTLEYIFETWSLPKVDLVYDTIFTTQADTVVLVAQEGFAAYNWSDFTINDSLVITDNSTQKYVVTVTDDHACGSDSDSTQIITYNIGLKSLLSPASDCSHTSEESVSIVIEHNSNDLFLIGDKITVSYVFNGGAVVTDTITLTAMLFPAQTLNYTFDQKIDMSEVGTYTLKVFTDLDLDAYRANDTLVDAIRTFGYPSIELGNDIYTTEPETATITAPTGYTSYAWNDGTNTNTLSVTYPASRLYSVTVTNINGCPASDDINVFTYDVAASELITPFSQCELTNSETVNFDIINNSLDTLLSGETINVSYILNSGSPVNESFNLLIDSLKPSETVNYTFTQTANLSANQVHELKLFAELASIDVETNDILTQNVDYQKPTFDLGADVNTGNTQYTIDAGAGYDIYEWFDESDDQTFLVGINNRNFNDYYAVTVTNSYGCSADDSIQVTFTTTPDLAVTAMITPESGCWNDGAKYPVHIEITNSGVVNLNPGDNFIVGYKVDEETAVTETFNVITTMSSSDTRNYTFTDSILFASAKIYLIKPFVKLANDEDVSNDTLTTGTIVEITAPEVILGSSDTISTTGTSYPIQPSEAYSTYLWSDGSNGSELTVTETGLYSVIITDINGCSGEGSIYIKFLTTGLDNLIQGDGYKLTYFPNPVSEQLMVQFENKKSKGIIIEIVSSNGQVVYNNKISNVENYTERIDVTSFSNGVYYIRFNIDDEFYVRKIIIQ